MGKGGEKGRERERKCKPRVSAGRKRNGEGEKVNSRIKGRRRKDKKQEGQEGKTVREKLQRGISLFTL